MENNKLTLQKEKYPQENTDSVHFSTILCLVINTPAHPV